MLEIPKIAGVAFNSYQSGGRRVFLSNRARESHRLFHQIYRDRLQSADGFWAVRSRSLLRRLVALDQKRFCNAVIESAGSTELRTIAIWVRGHMGGYSGAPIIDALLRSPCDLRTRKACIRALRRMSAHHQLARIAERDLDPRVRRLASSQLAANRARGSHPERLQRFSRRAEHLPVAPSTRPLEVHCPTVGTAARQPKSVALIRSILMRIRSLVRLSKTTP